MDATARILTLAPLLWPRDEADALAARLPTDATDGLDALAALLAASARARATAMLAAAGDAPSPAPSRAELAARLAECERELTYVTRQRDAADSAHAALSRWAQRVVADIHALADGKPLGPRAPEYGHSLADDLRAIAARIDREPPQRAPGVVAGVAADAVDGWRVALLRATRGAGRVSIAMGDAVAEARQRAGGGEGRGERVEGAQQGAADVGGVAERVVVAEGVAELFAGGACISGDGIRVEVVSMLEHVVREHGGQRVRVVVDVLRGEGGSVHSESVSPTAATREAP